MRIPTLVTALKLRFCPAAFSAFPPAVPWQAAESCTATEPGLPCSSLTTLVPSGHPDREQCSVLFACFDKSPPVLSLRSSIQF